MFTRTLFSRLLAPLAPVLCSCSEPAAQARRAV